jgi:hypothetical protein
MNTDHKYTGYTHRKNDQQRKPPVFGIQQIGNEICSGHKLKFIRQIYKKDKNVFKYFSACGKTYSVTVFPFGYFEIKDSFVFKYIT